MRKSRLSVAALVMLGLVLLGLGATTIGALLTISKANSEVTTTREIASRYIVLERAVANEAFAEAGYRRAPSLEARERLEDAIEAVPAGFADVRKLGDRKDGKVLSRLALLNRRYVDEVRSTLDQPRSAQTGDRVAGPALDRMAELLDATITKRRLDVTDATAKQGTRIQRLSLTLPIVFVLAFGVLAWSWRLMLRQQGVLVAEAARHEQNALTDTLTRLPNRAALARAMDDALARPRTEAALLYLDLDRFKPVNDTLGHHAGDQVLREVARRLLETIRAGEVAARIGGDEFAVFLPRGRDARSVADRILAAFRTPFEVGGHQFDVGASIGMARFPQDGVDSETLLQVADSALYDAKHGGRGILRTAVRRSSSDKAIEPV